MVQKTFEIQTIPAIIPKSWDDLREKLSRVAEHVSLVQIDVCDGKFTPEASWPYDKKSQAEGVFESFLKEAEGLPFWDRLNFEIDMMVENPEEEAEKWIMAGASRLVIHLESTQEETVQEFFNKLRERGVEVVIALGIDTPIERLTPHLNSIDGVQCMGIEKIGFQGQPFDERVLEKIILLRDANPDLHISVDGGVNLDTAPALIEAGADRLVAGSAIFDSVSVEEAIKDFESLI
jgi:ribulose-phosphate 3-epimerase